MIEDTVFSHLHAILTCQHSMPVQSCRVSVEMQRPWAGRIASSNGRCISTPARRQIVPAESTDEEIAEVVASLVPGRLYGDGRLQF